MPIQFFHYGRDHFRRALWRSYLSQGRQKNAERRAARRLSVKLDGAAEPLYDSLDNRESETLAPHTWW